MHEDRKRRNLLQRIGLVALGSAGIAGISTRADAESSSAPLPWRLALVTAVRPGAVQIDGDSRWLPMEGFPAGWTAAAGDEVAVAPALEGSGLTAHPVCHWVTCDAAPADLEPRQRIGGHNGPQVMGATILEPDLATGRRSLDRAPKSLKIAVVNTSSKGAERIIAIYKA